MTILILVLFTVLGFSIGWTLAKSEVKPIREIDYYELVKLTKTKGGGKCQKK
jgi:hypothetical protein